MPETITNPFEHWPVTHGHAAITRTKSLARRCSGAALASLLLSAAPLLPIDAHTMRLMDRADSMIERQQESIAEAKRLGVLITNANKSTSQLQFAFDGVKYDRFKLTDKEVTSVLEDVQEWIEGPDSRALRDLTDSADEFLDLVSTSMLPEGWEQSAQSGFSTSAGQSITFALIAIGGFLAVVGTRQFLLALQMENEDARAINRALHLQSTIHAWAYAESIGIDPERVFAAAQADRQHSAAERAASAASLPIAAAISELGKDLGKKST